MTRRSCGFLIAALTASSTCLSAVSAQCQPSVAVITGEVRNPASREVAFTFTPPSGLGSSDEKVALDSLNRFRVELPVSRGILVMGYYDSGQPRWKWVSWIGSLLFDHNPLTFFVEPLDSLHVTIDPGYFGSTCSFSGPDADNSRFIAEWIPRFLHSHHEYEGLELEDFKRQADRRRREQIEFLAERRDKYSLSPGFIDFATAYFSYEWASSMISYPTNYRFANGHRNREITPEYYDFLEEIPLVDVKGMGVGSYQTFLERTFDWELQDSEPRKRPLLSELRDLTALNLSEETQARLDSLYEKSGRRPRLSKMVDLSAAGLGPAAHARLDSLYEKKRSLRLSRMFDLPALGVPETAQAELDSFFEKSGRSYSLVTSSEEEAARVDTTGGELVFRLPQTLPIEEQIQSIHRTPKLSEKVALSELGLSPETQAQLDSLYEHPKSLKLSDKIDLSGIGLSETALARLDSIYADTGPRTIWSFSRRYDLAKQKLEGRVLYWFLAGELIDGFRQSEAFALAHEKWEDFREINPYPEYTEAVQAAMDIALLLQPGQPAPEFTLDDLDGQPVSLSQFRGKVVLLDFWASWCGPCIGDLPHLRQIKERTAGQPVVFLNLSLDTDEAAWRKAIQKHGIEGVHVRAHGFYSDPAKSYNINGIPSYFLVDSQGVIADCPRVRETDEMVAAIEKSL